MPLSRRALLRGALGLGSLAVVGGVTTLVPGAGAEPGQSGALLRSARPLPAPFTRPLRLPPVLAPSARLPGQDRYRLVQSVASQRILPDVDTAVWGYDGIFPGPTLELTRGRTAVVEHTNRLPVPTVVHLHGGHTPASEDGFPTDLLSPVGAPAGVVPTAATASMAGMADPRAALTAGTRTYTYPVTQRAALLWYHDHRMGFTAPAIWNGLAGMVIVRDPEEAALPLPRGERELPLMVCDRSFAADGSMPYPALDPTLLATPGVASPYDTGLLGDVVLVNGVPWPVAEVPAARHRLRLLNSSNARRYRLALSPPPPGGGGFVQIGTDGGLLGAPVVRDRMDFAPAERLDVVVDFARWRPGQEVTLVNELGSGSTAVVMRFRVGDAVADDSAVPARLSDAPTSPPVVPSGTPERTFTFRNDANGVWTIDGEPFDPVRADATVPRGTTEVWRFSTDSYHPVHVHLDPFLVLSRDGRDPVEGDAGWKDTIDLAPYEQAAVLVRFDDYAGRYLLHCHNLEHEDMAMMSMFTVT